MKRYVAAFSGMAVLLLLLIIFSICVGSVNISVSDIADIFTGANRTGAKYHIIYDIRLPRILAAVLLGGALSVSGFLLQIFFGNPIAGPYVLGISSGAKLFVAITMIVLLGHGIHINSFGMIAAAFVGSIAVMGFVLIISSKVNRNLLVVCGVLVGYICSAITDFFITFADDSNIVNLHNWSLGSFSGINWNNVYVISAVTLTTLVVTFIMSKPIGAFRMGESYALNMGVNVLAIRVAIILLSSVLSACVTAFAGPISFVGIAVPHLTKIITRTTKPIIMIPAVFLAGGIITLVCDDIARTVFAPTEISISSVTAVLLVPVVITMMIKTKKGEN